LLDFQSVTLSNIESVKKTFPVDQKDQVEEENDIAVYEINNTIEGIKGKLTVWYNKEMACLDIRNDALVMTEEYAEAKDPLGLCSFLHS